MTTDKHSSIPLPIGHELKEYRIEEVLMITDRCISYRALDTNLNVQVMIKEYFPAGLVCRGDDYSLSIINTENADEYAKSLKLFLEQVISIANLKYPNIARMIRYFAINRTGYMVTEYEAGQSLAEYLSVVNGPFDEETLLNIFVPVLLALEQSHQEEIIHGSLQPLRILIKESGEPLLLDFCETCWMSIASSESQSIYAEHVQLSENVEDVRTATTDIYSLGATMYQCVTGILPVAAEQRNNLIEQGERDPLQLAALMPDLLCSHGTLSLIDSMMFLNKEARPQTIRVVLDALGIPVSPKVNLPATIYRKLIKAPNPEAADKNESLVKGYEYSSAWNKKHKLIISGVTGSGKSTAIKTLSDIFPMVREEKVISSQGDQIADQSGDNVQKTIRMDYGLMKIADSESLHLYGAPAYVQPDYFRNFLQQGAVGLILLIDNSRKDPLRDLTQLLAKFSDQSNVGLVLGITHVDVSRTPSIADYHTFLASKDTQALSKVPVFSVDTRDYQHMSLLVQSLLYSIDQTIDEHLLQKDPQTLPV